MSVQAVYLIRNTSNGKGYIGSTSDYYRRRCAHLSTLRKNRHHSILLQRAFNKHGEATFEFSILEKVDNFDSLIIREQKYLDFFHPIYNISETADHPPGMKGRKFTEDHKRKLSIAQKGNKNCLGNHHSVETRKKMRDHHNKNSNLPKSKETRKKHSIRSKAWHDSLTDEQKKEWTEKISEANKLPLKETNCIICNKKIIYSSCGKYTPKTCGEPCLSEYRKGLLKARRKADPDMDRQASLKRWSNMTPEKRKEFAKRIGDTNRLPLKKTKCTICHNQIKYRSAGKQIPKTCGGDCLSELRRRLLQKRRDALPCLN